MVTIRPEVTLRTTTNDGGQAPAVVAGYGPSPSAAIRDLTLTAKATARGLMGDGDGNQFEVVGVRLVPGQVPDNQGARGDTVHGWCAYGTMLAVTAVAERRAG